GAAQALRDLDDAGTRVVAVDLPTGVHPDTGEIARRAVRADLTVTFGHPKRGQWLYPGRAFVGALEVVDIGLIPAPDAARFPVKLTTEMTLAAPQSAGRTLARAALERIQAWAERADAVLIGSGLSRDPESAGLARALVAARALPTVLDADGLNAYEGTEGFDSR